MTRRLIFIQGAGEGAHAEDAKLVASLRRELGRGYSVRYPEVADEGSPDFEAWKRALDYDVEAAGEGVIVVAHSAGAAMTVMWLAEQRKAAPIGGLFLIAAPFMGEGGWKSDAPVDAGALGAAVPEDVPIHFYHGTRDEIVPFAHLGLYGKAVPRAILHRLAGRDHQLNCNLSEVARDIEELEAREA